MIGCAGSTVLIKRHFLMIERRAKVSGCPFPAKNLALGGKSPPPWIVQVDARGRDSAASASSRRGDFPFGSEHSSLIVIGVNSVDLCIVSGIY